MKRTRVMAFVVMLLAGSMFQVSCGDIVIQSVKTGLLLWASGNLFSSSTTGQLNNFLNGIFTGGVTTPLPGTST